tara:strand:- start:4951 stop:6546 length:1596 start_codon:yes stop_codon:yes gene_type:complete
MKYFNFKRYNFFKIFKNIKLNTYYFSKIYKSLNFNKLNFSKIYKILDFKQYKPSKIFKQTLLKKFKLLALYTCGLIITSFLVYLSAPIFYSYDKSNIENLICKDLEIKCSIKGKINYKIIPTPRIQIKNFILKKPSDNKLLAEIPNVEFKLYFRNLLEKNVKDFSKIELKNAKINFNLNEIDDYKVILFKKNISDNINIKKGKIEFYDKEEHISNLENFSLKYRPNKNIDELILKGTFLGDQIYVSLKNKRKGKDSLKTLIIKLSELNFLAKTNFSNSKSDKNIITGSTLVKKDKVRLISSFDYSNGIINLKEANLKNSFSDGRLDGAIKFKPFFDFNLNLDLNRTNFHILSRLLNNLEANTKKKLFVINKKINGKLNLTSEKVFSKNNFIDSFESQIKFENGNILIEKLLLSLGRFGAADLTGIIDNEKKFSNFRFSSNIFIDDTKRFFKSFGVYNKKNDLTNFFVSGNLDLTNLNLRLYEIFAAEKLSAEDTSYIEKEFNDFLLFDSYKSFLDFVNFKKFVQTISSESK